MKRIRLSVFVLAVALMPAAGTVMATDGALQDDSFLEEGARHQGVSVDAYAKAVEDQDRSQPLVDLVRANPREFGDIYFDWESTDPGFVVQYLGDSAPEIDTDIPIRLVRVENSYADLEATLGDLAALAKEGDPGETGFVSVGMDVVSNTVALGVDRPDAPFAQHADAHGAMVSISVEESAVSHACNSRLDCPHLRGGLNMVGNTYACSTGFNARRPSGNKVHISAGHCDWQTTSPWDLPNTQGIDSRIGWSQLNGLHNGKDTDALRIGIALISGVRPTTWNLVYDTNARKGRSITRQIDNNGIFHGMIVRKSGVATNTTQGSITGGRYLVSYNIEGWPRFHWVFPANYAGQPGDSGGTVWREVSEYAYIVGIHSGEQGGNRIFASQQDARAVLDVSWCLNSGCN